MVHEIKVNMPKFSVICTDYEKWISRDEMREGIKSLKDQTFKDFELIVVHDGPKEIPYSDEVDFGGLDVKFLSTPEHMNNWGHSSRKLGMESASGEYFINFNINNIFYYDSFEKLNDILGRIEEKVVVFQIMYPKHIGEATPFTGIPPVHCNIDCMQLIAHRDIWKAIGWWYKFDMSSDGMLYEEICTKYPWFEFPNVLGVNR